MAMDTYVIQIGTKVQDDAVASGGGDLRGTIEHVGSGRREPFRDDRELLVFLKTEHSRESEEVER